MEESTLERQRRVDAIGDGFEGLVARHGDYIYRLAIAIIDIDDAADVAQDVLVTAWRAQGAPAILRPFVHRMQDGKVRRATA